MSTRSLRFRPFPARTRMLDFSCRTTAPRREEGFVPRPQTVIRHLLKAYPDAKIALRFSNPLELLIATILSAQCTDARVNEVTRVLFKKYRKAADYADADTQEFEQAIHATGFYRNKSKMIRQCCRKLVEEFHGQVPRDVDALTSLPGVGRKTANLVRGTAFGEQAIAVDTHVKRVSNRLGLADARNPDQIEQQLMDVIPEDQWTRVTLALILHGREICTARNPGCPSCPLRSVCTWPGKTQHVQR